MGRATQEKGSAPLKTFFQGSTKGRVIDDAHTLCINKSYANNLVVPATPEELQ
jgi:hypothetical protein